ncbi:MAG: hypothetical protein R2848_03305 [Thermomicrobiales bacterium]
MEHARDFVRIVLQISIHGDHGISARQGESIGKRLGFSEVATVLDGFDVRVDGAQPGDLTPGAIGRTVIDEQDFPFDAGGRQHGAQALMKLG